MALWILSVQEWLPISITAFVFGITSLCILRSEIYRRGIPSAQFPNPFLKHLSILCMVFSFLCQFFWMLYGFPGACTFVGYIGFSFSLFSGHTMGLYQVSRLYYCFSNSQVHSKRGYPKAVFIIMYTLLILSVICGVSRFVFTAGLLNRKCVILDNLQMTSESMFNIDFSSSVGTVFYIWADITVILLLSTDVLTLFLFCNKIKMFRRLKSDEIETIHRRVTGILYKVIILTIFYEVCFGYWTVINFPAIRIFPQHTVMYWVLTTQITTLSLNLSIYLMMDHNEAEYIKFLKCMNKSKCDYFYYCCCRYMNIEQLNYLDPDSDINRIELEVKGDGDPSGSSQWETRHESAQDYHIKTTGNEISIETTVAQNKDIK